MSTTIRFPNRSFSDTYSITMQSNEFAKNVMSKIRGHASAKGYTQNALAKKLNVSLPTLKRWLGGAGLSAVPSDHDDGPAALRYIILPPHIDESRGLGRSVVGGQPVCNKLQNLFSITTPYRELPPDRLTRFGGPFYGRGVWLACGRRADPRPGV